METCNFEDVASIILREIGRAEPVTNPDKNHQHWDKRWAEEKQPSYFRGNVVRDRQRFWRAPGFEFEHLCGLLRCLPQNCHIHEFGCGSGYNLEYIRIESSIKEVYGYDWSANAGITCMQRKIPFQQFDMLNPEGRPIGQPDVALTVHALEQLGENFHDFLNWLRVMKFKRAIHIEPIYELYDPYNIVDRLAMMWHDKRGYLKGLPQAVTPVKMYRTWIGGMMHEAYSVVEWYPS